jgi:hypothetical protein
MCMSLRYVRLRCWLTLCTDVSVVLCVTLERMGASKHGHCMFMCVYVYVYLCMCMVIHVCMYMCIYVYLYACWRNMLRMHTHTHTTKLLVV